MLSLEAESLRGARLGVWEYEGGGLGPDGSPGIELERFSWERDGAAAVSALVTEKRATV
jgi:hypothetical protein